MNNTEKKKRPGLKSFSLLAWGIIIMFISLAIFGGFLFFRLSNPQSQQSEGLPTSSSDTNLDLANVVWEDYSNDKYGFVVNHPPLLLKQEIENEGGFLFFVRFEENKFSLGKGIAIGIADTDKDSALKTIKESILDESGKEPISDEKIDVDGSDATELIYQGEGDYESRAFVVFEKDGLTYSISTVPDQISRVIESFKFTDN